jgi:hypothetical protein
VDVFFISKVRRLLALSPIVILFLNAGSDTGTLEGKVAITSEKGDLSNTVPNAVLRLTNDVRPISIRSDENGAFVAELEVGVHCIEDVRDAMNKKLHRIEDQARCFRIVSGRRTHFDIHVRAK